MKITVLRVPGIVWALLRRLPGWQQTLLNGGQRISVHLHKFLAVYFTADVSYLDSEAGAIPLPSRSMVIVPSGRKHGWRVDASTAGVGTVGHFHAGHGVHHVTA
jgi:hypothetical protein